MSMLACHFIERLDANLWGASFDIILQLSAHPLTTAGMFLTLYLGLSAVRHRLQCSECRRPSDSI